MSMWARAKEKARAVGNDNERDGLKRIVVLAMQLPESEQFGEQHI